jgi:CRP-like cAMP-binding protein
VSVSQQRVCLLDALPDVIPFLGDDVERAREELEAPLVEHGEGLWGAPEPEVFDPLAMGLFVMEGLLTRRVRLGDTTTTELIGPGDILGPPEYQATEARFPTGVDINVLTHARLALLDREATAVVCRWPPVVTWIVTASIRRAYTLAELLAVLHLRRVDDRLLVVLWQLANRFGRVQPEGVSVPLRLTHETLGQVVGAQRPSVTTALNQLEASGRLSRRDGGGWLLHGEPPEDLNRIT